MKKTLTIILALVLALGVLAGCGSSASTPSASEAPATEAPADASEAPAALTPLVVGASSTPHAEILESVKDVLAAEGYDLQVVVYDDYVLPNTALADGELDANYFQHTPYLNSFNASNGTDLVSAAKIHYEPFGIYGNGVSDLSELQPGATIIIPADDSNETRALLLLQQEGLIKLPDDASAEKGVNHLDIVDDGGYNVTPVQADTVPKKVLNSYDPVTLETIKEDIVQTYGGDQLAKILERPLDDQVHPYVAGVHEYESGSTDVGDVGYAAPTLNLNVSTCCIGNVGHTWQMTAQAGSVLGHKGLLTAAKALALSTIRTMESPEVMEAAKAEFVAKTGGVYHCPLPDDVKPPVGRY